MPHLCELYPGICLTTELKARKTLSYGMKAVVGEPTHRWKDNIKIVLK
jgi:hypothetical protein